MTEVIPFVGATKKTIYDGYLKALEEIKDLKAQQLNPEQIAADKSKQTVLAQAATTTAGSVAATISTLRSTVDAALLDLSSKFESKVEELENLDAAIQLKDSELKEIYDIERKAETLAALINAYEVQKAKQREEQSELTKAREEELATINAQIKSATHALERKLEEQAAELMQVHERAESEWSYDFNRKKQQAEDELADHIASEKKAIAEQKAQVEAREAAVTERETLVSELQQKVDEIPAAIAKAATQAADKAVKDAKKDFEFETKSLTATKDAEKQVLENKVLYLEEALKAKEAANEKLATQLTEAYGRLENVATASVEGAKAQDTISKLLVAVNEKGGK